MAAITESLLTEMVHCIVDALHPERIYLFGSQAYGVPHPHSDLDFLVVVSDDAGDPDELSLAGRRALLDYPFSVDLLVYHRSDMDKWSATRCSLPHTAVTKGRELYAAATGTRPAMA